MIINLNLYKIGNSLIKTNLKLFVKMITTLIISIREFLEAFLIIGVFMGINQKLGLKKTKEIISASLIGIFLAILLPIITFYFADLVRKAFNEKNTELLEGYLLIFSGFFITYVVFSLHKTIHFFTNKKLLINHQKTKDTVFDVFLFLLIIFFIIREGFEIALFTSSISLFTDFLQNLFGLFLGFIISAIIGVLTYFSFIKFPLKKIYFFTEWLIIFLGGSMIINGLNEIIEIYFNQKLSSFLPIKIDFLPSTSTFIGHFLKNTFALQQDFSLLILLIMGGYIYLVRSFLKKLVSHKS